MSSFGKEFLDTMRRLLLVGCPHSGTTLLQQMLAEHSQIFSCPPITVSEAPAAMPILRRRTQWRFPGQRRRQYPFSKAAIVDKPVKRRVLHTFRRLIDRLAQKKSAAAWVSPLPMPLLYIELVPSCIPDAKFIHVLRDGNENLPLLYAEKQRRSASGREPDRTIDQDLDRELDQEACIDEWMTATRVSMSYLNRPNHLIIRYDQLTQNPEATIRRVCSFADLPFEEATTKIGALSWTDREVASQNHV